MSNKPEAYIFDLDGTLAEHVARGPFDEHKVYTDEPIKPVAAVLRALVAYHYPVIFVSGRTEGCREETKRWIRDKIFNGEKRYIFLYMREAGDYRGDAIIKKEIYEKYIFPNYTVLGAFDDRMRVCKMLYDNSIFCFNVNQGLKEF